MMKKILSFALVLVTAFSITSCDGIKKIKKTQTDYPVEIFNVNIYSKPKKIASLSPMLTNILIDLGCGEELIAVSDNCFKPNESTKPTIGTGIKPNYQKIGELSPEIIFTNTPIPAAQMQMLSDVKIKVVVVTAPKTIDEFKVLYLNLISIMKGNIERSTTGKASIDELSTQLDSIKTKLSDKQISFIFVENLDPIVATGDTFESNVLSLFGNNLLAEKTAYNVTNDEIKLLNPDVIFFSNSLTSEHIKASDLFKKSAAVLNNKLISVDADVFNRPTRFLPKKISEIATMLYPDLTFPDIPNLQSSTYSESLQ